MKNTTYNKTLQHSPKTISGIDTLYYFCESNNAYDNLFLDILNQIDETKERFEKRNISYEYKDIKISINNQFFYFNGKTQGFYWFTHFDEYIKVGFKDTMTNRGLNDIQVQFTAIGIYTLGIKTLLQYTEELLKEYTTGYKPLTRVDLNIFVEDDLSWIDKSMFVSRKRSYTSIYKEVATKHKLQTLYIGKKPFLLRIYDKLAELKNSKKRELMYQYFKNNGFVDLKHVTNVEFELHRDYFKSFEIDTIEELLVRAELLFQDCLNAIRLVDLSSITDNTADAKNKNRARMHPLWKHLFMQYRLNDFLSMETPLQRIKRKNYAYTIEKAIEEHLTVAKKAYVHDIVIDEQFYQEVLRNFRKIIGQQAINKPLESDIQEAYIFEPAGCEIAYETIQKEDFSFEGVYE